MFEKMPDEREKEDPQVYVEPDASPTPIVSSRLYQHNFLSEEGKAARKALLPSVFLPLVFNGLLIWACLSLFFGSLKQNADISKIDVRVVNLDDGYVGAALVAGIQTSLRGPGPHLKWIFEAGGSDERSRNLVLDEEAWAVLQGMSFTPYIR